MNKGKTKTKDDKKITSLNVIGADSGMVCGPDGCSLADHFDWAKNKEEKKNK